MKKKKYKNTYKQNLFIFCHTIYVQQMSLMTLELYIKTLGKR